MRAYAAQIMDRNENLFANLETTKSEAPTAQELVEESVGLLRKVEKKKEVS